MLSARHHYLQMVPGDGGLHPEMQGDAPIKKWREWFKAGKPKDKFDTIWMGLNMMTYPTKQFGWEGMTTTMKKASFFLAMKQFKIGVHHLLSQKPIG